MTLGGNSTSAGAGYALASTGTVTLAGGNNVTLSQNGNAITISAANGGGAAGTNTLGMSNLGNSVGTSGVITGSNLQMAFAGGNNVTLSQSINASSATITVSAANQTVQTQNLHNLTLAGNSTSAGAGYIQISSGTATLAGGNNVTLSQNGNAVTISAFNQSAQTQNMVNATLAGNSTSAGAGYALMSSGTMTIAGGNNVTLSQNGNAVTVSAFNQSNQTAGLYAVSNTTQSSSATVDARSLSFAGAGIASVGATNGSVVVSVPAGGGAAGTNTLGMSNLGNTSGTTGVVTGSNVQFAFAGGNNITLSQSIDASSGTITISAGAGGAAPAGSYFDNMFQQNSVQGITFTSVSTGMFGRVIIQPLAPGNELFPYELSASTMRLGFSNSGSSNASGAFSSSYYFGLYTRVNSTQLSLLNSVSTSYGLAAATNNSASFLGARWLSFNSSQFSAQPVLRAGSRYFFALLARTSSNSYASHSMAGMHLGHSIQRSGYMATAASSNTSFNAWHPFMGVHSLTTHTALPGSLGNADINKASVYANFVPQVIFDAGLGAQN